MTIDATGDAPSGSEMLLRLKPTSKGGKVLAVVSAPVLARVFPAALSAGKDRLPLLGERTRSLLVVMRQRARRLIR